MDLVWSRFLRSAYRKEPITSVVITSGVVAAAIGGLDEHWLLAAVGLGTVGLAIVLRWWQQERRTPRLTRDRPPVYALPPRSSRPILPALRLPQKPPGGKRRAL